MVDRVTISPEEFAEATGVPSSTVRKWLRDGILRGTRVGKLWLIPVTELERFANPPGKEETEPKETDA